MGSSSIRVLVAEDYQPFRKFLLSTLQSHQFPIICEVDDGLRAVQQAAELQPELILLDIGLPTMNGIEAARRIRKVSPRSKIVVVSEESSIDVVHEALRSGASGFVVKKDAGRELFTAISAVLRGERFIGRRFAGDDFTDEPDLESADSRSRPVVLAPPTASRSNKSGRDGRHEVLFYSEENFFLKNLTQFIGTTLKAGDAAIVLATQAHRDALFLRLKAYGLELDSVIEQGRYIALDATDALLGFMADDLPDSPRFVKLLSDLIVAAANSAGGPQSRVVVFGECARLLWEQGKREAAIQVEKLGNILIKKYRVDILCAYARGPFHTDQGSHMFQRIRAEHSAMYSQ